VLNSFVFSLIRKNIYANYPFALFFSDIITNFRAKSFGCMAEKSPMEVCLSEDSHEANIFLIFFPAFGDSWFAF
jgi:hypothetical protein